MAKGTACLRITGILLIIFGIMSILFAMIYGFVGALAFDELGKDTLTGLLIFYGLVGILMGFFQIGVGAMCIHQAKREDHWTRCVVWGIVLLLIGIFCTILLFVTAGQIHVRSSYYPQWFAFVIVIVGGIVLPLLVILGGILNRSSHIKGGAYFRAVNYAKRQGMTAGADQKETEPRDEKTSEEEPGTAEEETETKEAEKEQEEPEKEPAEVPASQEEKKIRENPSGRLAYKKGQRLSRIVDPRLKRRFER